MGVRLWRWRCVSWLCARGGGRRARGGDWVLVLGAGCARGGDRVPGAGRHRPTAASDSKVPAVMGRMNLCTQYHTVLSLERSLSVSAVVYLRSSGSVLADGCVKGCTVCAHTFVRTMFYAQRQALNRPLFQHVSACYTQNSRAGYCLALGE